MNLIDSIKILYVDDDPDDFFLVSSLLKRIKETQYELISATSLTEATALIDESFDAFLVDYRLGKDTGLDLISKIREVRAHAPIIMLTGMSTGSLDREALTLGVSDYLVKGSFDAITLDRTIRYAIRDTSVMKTLDEAARKFRSIFELAGDPFLLIDYERKIIEANPAFIKKFGKNAFVPNSEKEFFFEKLIKNDQTKNELKALFDTEFESYDLEAEMQIENNQIIETLISIVKQDNSIYQVLIKDLTALKAKEEEELNLKKFSSTGRIARLLAHEVKNPLTTILLSADQLDLELPDKVKQESGDLLDVIRRNCNRINHLVTQLLESTRFSDLDLRKYSINTLLEEAVAEVEDRLKLNGIQVQKNYSADICEILVDPEKVKIAFVNLIVNAIEAMPENNGKLQLRTSIKGNICKVEIKDNGVGIPPEKMERLFEPFFTSKSAGSGLGLTNTQNIILSHGGSIRVKSEENKGTSFIINFNLSDGLE